MEPLLGLPRRVGPRFGDLSRSVRRGASWFVLAITLLGLDAQAARAQVRTPTAADSADVLHDAARTFAAQGRPEVAAALYRLIIERYPTSAAAELARAALAAMDRSAASSGATELQVWSALYGAWLGLAVPWAFGADSAEPYGLGLLVGAPAGFVIARKVARAKNLSIGQARAITLGGSWGTWQGFGWSNVFDLGEEMYCDGDFCYNEDTVEETVAGMIIGGVAGITTGALLSRRPISDATATAANSGAFWGSWFGVALGVIGDLEGDDLLAATLVGGDVALLGAVLAAPSLGWSRDRWRIVSSAGLLGGVAGAGIDLLLKVDDQKSALAIPLASSLVGLVVGARITRDHDGLDGGGAADGARAPDGGAMSGGLVDVRNGRVTLGAPMPLPTMLPIETPQGVRWRPTLGVPLVRVVW